MSKGLIVNPCLRSKSLCWNDIYEEERLDLGGVVEVKMSEFEDRLNVEGADEGENQK